MATIPTMRNWVDGEIVTPQLLNDQIRDAGEFFKAPPMCVVTKNVDQPVAQDVPEILTWNGVSYDNDNIWNGSDGFVVQTRGLYALDFSALFNDSGSADGTSVVRIYCPSAVGGAITYEHYVTIESTSRHTIAVSGLVPAEVGDVIQAEWDHSLDGGNPRANGSNGVGRFSIQWVGPL